MVQLLLALQDGQRQCLEHPFPPHRPLESIMGPKNKAVSHIKMIDSLIA